MLDNIFKTSDHSHIIAIFEINDECFWYKRSKSLVHIENLKTKETLTIAKFKNKLKKSTYNYYIYQTNLTYNTVKNIINNIKAYNFETICNYLKVYQIT